MGTRATRESMSQPASTPASASAPAGMPLWRQAEARLYQPLLKPDEGAGPISDAVVFAPTLPINEAGFDQALARKSALIAVPHPGTEAATDNAVALASVLCYRAMLRAAGERDDKVSVGFVFQAYSKLLADAQPKCPLSQSWVDAVFVCSLIAALARLMGEDNRHKVKAVLVTGNTLKQLQLPSAASTYGPAVLRIVQASPNYYAFNGKMSLGSRQMAGIVSPLYDGARSHAQAVERLLSTPVEKLE